MSTYGRTSSPTRSRADGGRWQKVTATVATLAMVLTTSQLPAGMALAAEADGMGEGAAPAELPVELIAEDGLQLEVTDIIYHGSDEPQVTIELADPDAVTEAADVQEPIAAAGEAGEVGAPESQDGVPVSEAPEAEAVDPMDAAAEGPASDGAPIVSADEDPGAIEAVDADAIDVANPADLAGIETPVADPAEEPVVAAAPVASVKSAAAPTLLASASVDATSGASTTEGTEPGGDGSSPTSDDKAQQSASTDATSGASTDATSGATAPASGNIDATSGASDKYGGAMTVGETVTVTVAPTKDAGYGKKMTNVSWENKDPDCLQIVSTSGTSGNTVSAQVKALKATDEAKIKVKYYYKDGKKTKDETITIYFAVSKASSGSTGGNTGGSTGGGSATDGESGASVPVDQVAGATAPVRGDVDATSGASDKYGGTMAVGDTVTVTVAPTQKKGYGQKMTNVSWTNKDPDCLQIVSTSGTSGYTASAQVKALKATDEAKIKVKYYYKDGSETKDETITIYFSVSKASSTPSTPTTPTTTSITGATVAAIADQVYTGSAITPEPVVTIGAKTLVKGTDYTVSYANNTAAGTATVTITGKGSYTGTTTASFKIVAADAVAGATVSAGAGGAAVTLNVGDTLNIATGPLSGKGSAGAAYWSGWTWTTSNASVASIKYQEPNDDSSMQLCGVVAQSAGTAKVTLTYKYGTSTNTKKHKNTATITYTITVKAAGAGSSSTSGGSAGAGGSTGGATGGSTGGSSAGATQPAQQEQLVATAAAKSLVKAGKTGQATVTVSGAGTAKLSYQWQYSKNGSTWTNDTISSATTATYKPKTNANYTYRCVVTASDGRTATTGAIKLTK